MTHKARAHEYVNFQRHCKERGTLTLLSSIPALELDDNMQAILGYHKTAFGLHELDTIDFVFLYSTPVTALRYVWHKHKPTPPLGACEIYDCFRAQGGWLAKLPLNPYVDPYKTKSKKRP